MIFSRTQNAYNVPFNAADPAASQNGFTASRVFGAIIEAKTGALARDKYPVYCSSTSTVASTNTRLAIWQNIASNIAPFLLPANSRIVAYSFSATAAATGTIIIRNITTSTNIVTITFSAQTAVTAINLVLPIQSAGSRIEVFVGSGTFNRPTGVFWLNET